MLLPHLIRRSKSSHKLCSSYTQTYHFFYHNTIDSICNDPAQSCRYCPLRAQGAITALKHVYKVERSPYLYSARKFLPYPMWDVTNTPPMQTQRPRCVPWDYGAKRNKPPHQGRGSALIPFFFIVRAHPLAHSDEG